MDIDLEKYKFTAHRGLYDNRNGIPENTIPAFEKAVEKGYAIELDVNMSNDGFLVIFHDNSLKRMTGVKEDITTLDLHEIRRLKLVGTDIKIPTLQDVLLCIAGKVPLIIEVKQNERYKELMEKLIKELSVYNGEYIIESFDPRVVYWLKENKPEIIRGQLAGRNVKEIKGRILKILLGNMVFNVLTKPNFISYHYYSVDKKFYNKQKKKKRLLAVWTVKSKEEYEKIKNCSDIVIFENEETIL